MKHITIRINSLSPDAQEAVGNAGNKSDFVRKAIEAYVKEGQATQKSIESIEKTVLDIKNKVENLKVVSNNTNENSEKEKTNEEEMLCDALDNFM